jgi:sulfite reductase (NADPH) flavoprotein alpha-component
MHDVVAFIVSNALIVLASIAVLALIMFVLIIMFLQRKSAKEERFDHEAEFTVLYASQRGRAKNIALQTCAALQAADFKVQRFALGEIEPNDLRKMNRALIVTSTFGSGESPESARGFARRLKKTQVDLSHLDVAVLALGDQTFDRFCGFGRDLDQWLQQQHAQRLSPLICVDRLNSESLGQWAQLLVKLGVEKVDLDPTASAATV